MKKFWLRSLIFNLVFFGITGALSVLYIPALILPRRRFVVLIRFWLRVIMAMEYGILGLKYEITGIENLPEQGAYIVAAKHQSAYETLKLHLLFYDPAIILKKELLWIPLFGAYLKKSGAIAIDRASPESALRSVQSGVLRVTEEGRPIIIFPQGTRVAPDTTTIQKPYKPGIVRIQEVTDLPIIPMALNSGLFWPRNSWLKSPGTVTFQFLKPIQPGKDRQTLMRELEDKIESATNILVAEARLPRHTKGRMQKSLIAIIAICMLCFLGGFYVWWWKNVAQAIMNEYAFRHRQAEFSPEITGFPGPMKITLPEETIETPDGAMLIKKISVHGLPLPFAPITLSTGEITVSSFKWAAPLTLGGSTFYLKYLNRRLTIEDSLLTKDDFRASASGTIDWKENAESELNLVVRFINHQGFLNILAQDGIIDQQTAVFMGAGFTALADSAGMVTVPVTQRGRTLYAGPFAFAELPEWREPIAVLPSAAPESLLTPSP